MRSVVALLLLAACENVDFLHDGGRGPGGELPDDGQNPAGDLTFAQMTLPPASSWVNVVWGFGRNDVYAGVGHRLFHYDGSEWTVRGPTPSNLEITALAGHSGQVFVGAWSQFYVYDGTVFTNHPTGGIYAITDMIAFAPDQVYFTVWITNPNPAGGLYKFDGVEVSELLTRPDTDLNGLWGPSPAELYLVGSFGKILRYADGLVYDESVVWDAGWGSLSNQHFIDVTGIGSDRVAVGTGHMIFTRQGGAWTVSRPPAAGDEELWSVAGWQDGNALVAFAAGEREGGAFLRLSGSWQPVTALPPNVVLATAWSAEPGHLIVGGGYSGLLDPYMALGSAP